MRSSQTCPKCSGKKLAVMNEFKQPDHDSANLVHTLPAVTVSVAGLFGDRKSLGKLESWICLGCGYTELYAKQLAGVEELARMFPEQVRIVDAPAGRVAPFR